MKKIIFSCDGPECKRQTIGEAEDWLEIGTDDDNDIGLEVRNGIDGHRLESLSKYHDIHFCSKKCFG